MTFDTFLYCTKPDGEVIIMEVYSFSFGYSSPSEYGGRYSREDNSKKEKVYLWKTEDVIDWLKKSNLDDLIGPFTENGITGTLLPFLKESHLAEMGIKKVGTILRFQSEISDLSNKAFFSKLEDDSRSEPKEESKVSCSSINIMCKTEDRAIKLLGSLFAGTVFPECRLATFTGAGGGYRRRNQPAEEDEAAVKYEKPALHTCTFCIVGKDAVLESVQFSGSSGGDDTPTCSMSVDFKQFTIYHNQYPDTVKSYKEFFPEVYGQEIFYDVTTNKTFSREWGKVKSWNFKTHFSFPKEFKDICKEMMLIAYRDDPSNYVSTLPRAVLFIIFEKLSNYYLPTNMLKEMDFPQKIVPEGEKQEDNDW